MKTQSPPNGRRKGSVLIITMCIIAVAAIALASYFGLVQYQTAAVARSQTWNSALPLAEAGLDEAMALINKGAPNIITDAWAWTNNLAGDGWSSMTNGRTSVTRVLSGTDGYTVSIDINSGTPEISAAGNITYTTVPWVFSSLRGPFLAAQGGQQVQTQPASTGRKVLVTTVPDPLFAAAIVTKSNFNMKGNNTVVDSFDSGDPLASTNGQYSVLLHRANGDVATDSSIVDTLNIANGNIYGRVLTGPGTVQSAVQIGSQGAVGNIAWNLNPVNRGKIQPGYWSGDFNMNIPDVKEPTFAGGALPSASNGVITVNGVYTTATPPNAPLNVVGPTTIWVQGSFSQNITIASTNNAKLIMYVGTTNANGGDSLDLHGLDYINSPGNANNLQFYGLPSLNSIDMTGNSAFAGTIYAPSAALKGGGSGNNVLDTSGSVIVGSITLNGHWNFHYDERLKTSGPTRGWVAKDWKEIVNN